MECWEFVYKPRGGRDYVVTNYFAKDRELAYNKFITNHGWNCVRLINLYRLS
jgi:hypothetical protein